MSKDSLSKRYRFKLVTNFVSLPVSFIAQLLVPRMLGAVSYGNFGFLTDFFSRITSFFESGTSLIFFTKLSKRQTEDSLVKFYWQLILAITLLIGIVLFTLILLGTDRYLFPGQEIKFIWLAFLWALLTWISQVIQRTIDAYGLTRMGETVRIVQKVVALFLILLLFFLHRNSLDFFFLYHFFILFFLIGAFWVGLSKGGYSLFPKASLSKKQRNSYLKEFHSHSSPLFIMSFIIMVAGILDRWLLQIFSGSAQQGYYSLAYQIGAVCFLFTSAMTPILIREMAIASSENKIYKMRYLFQQYIPRLYAIAAFLSIFLAFQAKSIVSIIGGKDFLEATPVFSIMILYPIHQTYGQLSGSLFYATNRTKIFSKISIFGTLVAAPLSFFFIAPARFYGLSMGAEGLAIKMIVWQLLITNIQIWHNCKMLGISYRSNLLHQTIVIALFSGLAFVSFQVTKIISFGVIGNFFLTGFVYLLFSVISIWYFPKLVSSKRKEFIYLKNRYLWN